MTQHWIDKQLWIILLWNDCMLLHWRSRWQLKVTHLRQSSVTISEDWKQHHGKAVFLMGLFEHFLLCVVGLPPLLTSALKRNTVKEKLLPRIKRLQLAQKGTVWTELERHLSFFFLPEVSIQLLSPPWIPVLAVNPHTKQWISLSQG